MECRRIRELFVLNCLFLLFNNVFGNVPVLIFESYKSNKENGFPALYRVSNDGFSQYLLKKVQGLKPLPLVVLFSETSLSVEDFSAKDSQGNGYFPKLKNITESAGGVEFIPSVESPIDAVLNLGNYGFQVQSSVGKEIDMKLPKEEGALLNIQLLYKNSDEDRVKMLRRHDDEITSIYSELLSQYSRVIVIFTGKQSSWVEPEEVSRLKREVRATNSTEIHYQAGTVGQQVLLYSSSTPVYFDGENTVDLSGYNAQVSKSSSGNTLTMLVKLYKGTPSMLFKYAFTNFGGYWTLDYVSVSNDPLSTTPVFLIPVPAIYAPLNMSYHSSDSAFFYSNSTIKASLTFGVFQVEPFFDELATSAIFHDAVDSVTFFTIPIWSGIFTVTILAMIVIWGISMIMDIRTMDQFDDPKGKTITVTTTE